MLEAVSGKRGRQHRMREHLFQLGPATKEVIAKIIYAKQRSWNDSIERLHELLQLYGDETLRASFERHCGRPGRSGADIAGEFALVQFPLPFRDGTNGDPRYDRPRSPRELEAMLKRLHLACARRSYAELVEQAERGAWFFRDFLAALASAEIDHRRQDRFPVLHTLEEFDFSVQLELRLLLLGSAFAPRVRRPGRLPRAQGP